MPLSENENELVRCLHARDETAMSRFYHQYSKLLYPVVLRIVRSPTAAEDVLQESMVKIWYSFPTYDATKGHLFSWALKVCRNTAIDHLRNRRAQEAKQTQQLTEQQFSHHAAPTTFQPEHVGVREYAQQLRPEYRRLIDLLYFEGLTQAEAAEALQMPLGTVKTHSRQSIKELVQLLR